MNTDTHPNTNLENWIQIAPSLFSTLPVGVAVLNASGHICYCNPIFSHQFNIEKGLAFADALPECANNLDQVLQQGSQTMEWFDAGNSVICLSPIQFNFGEGGALCCVYNNIASPVTLSTLPEVKKLILERDAIIDSITEGVWVCDAKGVVIRVNPVSARLSGAEPSEFLGKNMRELQAEDYFKDCATLEAIKQKTTVTRLVALKKTGIKVIATAKPIFDDKGELIMTVGTERDITKLEALHQFLEEQAAIQTSYQTKIKELQILHDVSQTFIAKSKPMLQVLEHIIKVSNVDSTVLILGESGVGKSAIANFIHKHSDRAQHNLLSINCASIPETLIESELFGYEKGAFTGAQEKGKPGLIEMAHGGTFFLDEIAELSLASQSKLLKFLDEGSIIRIGGTTKRQVDVRVIAATNRDLEQLVSEGNFRHDLYYRLNVISIHVPPLRERNECVLALLKHYINHFAEKMNYKRTLAPRTLERLLSYEYPGNIRELINICERIVVLTDREYVVPGDLPQHIFFKDGQRSSAPESLREGETLVETMSRVERSLLLNARNQYGSHDKMAKALGVTQPTITRKMKKYKLG